MPLRTRANVAPIFPLIAVERLAVNDSDRVPPMFPARDASVRGQPMFPASAEEERVTRSTKVVATA